MHFQEKGFKTLLLAAALLVAGSRGVKADTLRGVQNPLDALASTAAVVEGTVAERVSYTYDEMAGPRTVATLVDVRPIFGRYDGRDLAVPTLGGPINEKKQLFVPELPRLTEGTRYLVFLTNIDWFFSPVVDSYAFRVETNERGVDVLIAQSGHVVLGLTKDELILSPDPVVDTQIDFARPTAQLRLLEGASDILAGAMSKDDFLAAVRELASAVPIQGDYRTAPARDRVWNQLTTSAE
jgi:hypothetical protein